MEPTIAAEWNGTERRKSPRNKNEEDLKNLTRHILREFYNGNSETYFDHLAHDAVYICNGSKMLVSSDAIRDYMKIYDGHGPRVIDEECFCRIISNEYAYVYGVLRIGDCLVGATATIRFTLMYRTNEHGPVIIHHQNSYDFSTTEETSQVHLDYSTMAFIKRMIASRKSERTSFQSGGEAVWLGFDEVMYIQSVGKRTEIVCMDKVIACDTPIGKLIGNLPKRFVQVHRCYIVNTKHVTAVRRCEVELASDVIIPIPESRYADVRRDLLNLV